MHVYTYMYMFISELRIRTRYFTVSDWHRVSMLRTDTLRDMNFWEGCCWRSKTNEIQVLHLQLRDPGGEFTTIRRNVSNYLPVDTA